MKALFDHEILKFLLWLSACVKKRLDVKAKVNFRTYDVTSWQKKICNTYMVRSKSKQTIKFGQLMENITTNIFLKNHTQNTLKKLVPH